MLLLRMTYVVWNVFSFFQNNNEPKLIYAIIMQEREVTV
jgi:hypothetical protein